MSDFEHVEKMGHGAMCKACGGMVGDDGMAVKMAHGGEVEGYEDPSDTYDVPMKEAEQYMSDEGADSDQHESTERMTRNAGHKFADAVKRSRR
jgi:hypothetical protein